MLVSKHEKIVKKNAKQEKLKVRIEICKNTENENILTI